MVLLYLQRLKDTFLVWLQILKDKLLKEGGALQQKEACVWLNLMGQFLFQELRDTSTVRR